MTTGNGTVDVYNYPGQFKDDKLLTLQAHTQNCYCIRFCPRDKYFAVGGADALVSIWDLAT
jgi:THO complex subunit 3